MVNFGIAGVVLTGFSAVAYRFLGTNKGKRWLNRVIDWATERFYTQDPHRRQQHIIQGLESLNPQSEDGVLREGEEGFNEVLEHIEEDPGLNTDLYFETFDPADDIVRLERVRRDSEDYDELKSRGVQPVGGYYLDAVMEDGSRKIIDDISRVKDHNRILKEDLRGEKMRERRRFRNRIEDGIKWIVILVGVCGVGLIGYGYL